MTFESMAAYRRHATGSVSQPGMNYLTDLIVRPGIEKVFGPLLLYRGCIKARLATMRGKPA